ncbi:MAG: glutamate-1-semialdehyde 2,1-aminomutase [Firmicutes bacterium]|nr:glutamate-1-semialdehyde 2,1-aminomutase [Bacillota bacterium]
MHPLTNENAWKAAQKVIAGGVNSPSRRFDAVGGGTPVFIDHGEGAYLYDVEGQAYIDYLAAYGPVILGHGDPRITRAVAQAAAGGTVIGTPTPQETRFAQRLREAIPSMEQLRLVNTGTEAMMSAVRVARAYTGRDWIVKFAGSYHGHFDWVLVQAGSGPSTIGQPDSAGVPPSVGQLVATLPFNDADSLAAFFERYPNRVAAVLVEPIVGNFGMVMPQPGFLEAVSTLSHQAGALVIYDEVITGFRFRYGAAQDWLGVRPDLTALGKIIGGGLPIGAYGGSKAIMAQLAPLGGSYQAGTFAGNPVSVAAGLACLDALQDRQGYLRVDRLAQRLTTGLQKEAELAGEPVTINRIGGAFTLYFGEGPITDYASAQRSDGERFARFFQGMLRRGIHLAPSKYEAWFVSMAHTDHEIDTTLQAAHETFREMHR